jgi:hypothetical protein
MVMMVVVGVGLCPSVGTYSLCQQLLCKSSKLTVGSMYKYSVVEYVEFVGVNNCSCVCNIDLVVFACISILKLCSWVKCGCNLVRGLQGE